MTCLALILRWLCCHGLVVLLYLAVVLGLVVVGLSLLKLLLLTQGSRVLWLGDPVNLVCCFRLGALDLCHLAVGLEELVVGGVLVLLVLLLVLSDMGSMNTWLPLRFSSASCLSVGF